MDGVTILDLKGQMTMGGGDVLFKDKVNSLVQQNRTRIVLNLGEVSYVDSASLGVIVGAFTTVTNRGGKLVLLNLTKRIEDLLSITKLLTVFSTYDSEDAALTAAKA